MALAETARLVASLEMQDKFSGPLNKAGASLGRFQGSLGTIGKGVGQVGAGIERVAVRLVELGVAAGAALGTLFVKNLRSGIDELNRLELVMTQTNTVLASTKGVAGQTAESIREMSKRFEDLNATVDEKVIQSAANLLLSFTNIKGKAFEPALQAALNLNQALGGGEEGLQGTLIKVAKALNDPVKGLGLLGRVGITFSEDEKKKIKVLVESNQLYAAQTIVLDRLSQKFGGQFAAAGNTAAGRIAALHENVRDLQETLAGPFAGTGGVLDRVVGKLGAFLGESGTVAAVQRVSQAVAGLFDGAALDRGIGLLRSGLNLLSTENLAKIGNIVRNAFDFVKGIDFKTIGEGLKIAGQAGKLAIDAFLSLPKEAQAIAIAALAANKLSGGLVGSGLLNIGKGLAGLLVGGGPLGRGSSPANPVFVSGIGGVGGGPLGGLPVAGAPIVLIGLVAAAVTAAFIASQVGQKPDFVPKSQGGSPNQIIPIGRGFGPTSKHGTSLDVHVTNPKDISSQLPGAPGGGHPAAPDKPVAKPVSKLTDAQLITALAKTSEFGFAGVGTKIEHGPLIGNDPFGKTALELFRRAEFPKVGQTLGEIQRHIIAAEDAQQQFLVKGDINSAKQIQVTIDGLHGILGSTDKTIPPLLSLSPFLQNLIQKQETANTKADLVRNLFAAVPEGIRGLLGKNFSPTVGVTVNATTNVTVSNIIRSTTSAIIASGKVSAMEEHALF